MPPVETTELSSLRPRRVSLERRISLKFRDLQGFLTEYSENISRGGMFIKTRSPQAPGSLFDFELTLAPEVRCIQGIGEVVWVRRRDDGRERPAGMGVRFLDISPECRDLLLRVVGEPAVAPSDAAERRHRPAADGDGRTSPVDAPALPELPDLGDTLAWQPHPPPHHGAQRFLLPVLLTVGFLLAAVAIFHFSGDRDSPHPTVRRVADRTPAASTGVDPEGSETRESTPSSRAELPVPPSPGAEKAQTHSPAAATSPGVDAPTAEPPTTPQAPRPSGAATMLTDISWQPASGGLVVTLVGNGPFRPGSYSTFRLDDGSPREVVRLLGLRPPVPSRSLDVDSRELARIRVGYHRTTAGDEIHVVLDLGSPAVRLEGIEMEQNRLQLHLGTLH